MQILNEEEINTVSGGAFSDFSPGRKASIAMLITMGGVGAVVGIVGFTIGSAVGIALGAGTVLASLIGGSLQLAIGDKC